MTRAERRRLEREIAKTPPAPGRGMGWRLSVRGKRYPVCEHRQPVDIEGLISESERVAAALTTSTTEDTDA